MVKTDKTCPECGGELIFEDEIFVCMDCNADFNEDEVGE